MVWSWAPSAMFASRSYLRAVLEFGSVYTWAGGINSRLTIDELPRLKIANRMHSRVVFGILQPKTIPSHTWMSIPRRKGIARKGRFVVSRLAIPYTGAEIISTMTTGTRTGWSRLDATMQENQHGNHVSPSQAWSAGRRGADPWLAVVGTPAPSSLGSSRPSRGSEDLQSRRTTGCCF